MLYSRYADPLGLMSTYSLSGLADFIFKLFDAENDEKLYQTWLHKEMSLGYADFKKRYAPKSTKAKAKALSEAEEQEILKMAEKIIKPINKGGDANDG